MESRLFRICYYKAGLDGQNTMAVGGTAPNAPAFLVNVPSFWPFEAWRAR